MEFETTDLLTYKDFRYILDQNHPTKIAEFLFPKIKKHIIYYDDRYYELQQNITYKEISHHHDDFLSNKISGLYAKSDDMLQPTEKNDLGRLYRNTYLTISSIKTIDKYKSCIVDLFLQDKRLNNSLQQWLYGSI